MVGIFAEHRFQNGHCPRIGRVGLVRLRLRSRDIESAKNLGLVVIRVLGCKRLVCGPPGNLAFALGMDGKILVVGAYGVDVVALALRGCFDAMCLVKRRLRLGRGARGRANAGERIVHHECGDAPIGDRASGVFQERVAERLLARRVPKGMQHGHTPQQIWLGRRGAGIGESDRPQMMLHAGHVRRVMSGIRVLGESRRSRDQAQDEDCAAHRNSSQVSCGYQAGPRHKSSFGAMHLITKPDRRRANFRGGTVR